LIDCDWCGLVNRFTGTEFGRLSFVYLRNVNNVNNKFIEREGTTVSNALECRPQY